MAFVNIFSTRSAALAMPLRGRPSTSGPNSFPAPHSADFTRVTVSAPLMPRATLPSRNVIMKAATSEFEQEKFRKEAVSPHQWLMKDALNLPAPASKSAEGKVKEATQTQAGFIHALWSILLESLRSDIDASEAFADFSTALQAAPAGMLAAWPFEGSSTSMTNTVCCKYSIPDFIWVAFQVQQLQRALPFLEQLLWTATAVSPNNSPTLHETLSLLAEASTKSSMQPSQPTIIKLLDLWGLRELPVGGCMLHWRDDASGCVVSAERPVDELNQLGYKGQFAARPTGKLQQPRSQICSEAFAALHLYLTSAPASALQPAATPPLLEGSGLFDIQESPQYQTSLAEAVAAARAEEQAKYESTIAKLQAEVEGVKIAGQQAASKAASHAALGQEKTTKRRLAKKVASSKLNQSTKIDALLTMSETRNDQFAIKAYCVRHTNTFKGDFNARMVEKRKESLSEESADADAGGSATQSTGLPDEDVYV